MKSRLWIILGTVILVAIAFGAGSWWNKLSGEMVEQEQRLANKTQCGIDVIGNFSRGDYLEQTVTYKGDHKSYFVLTPQPKSQQHPNKHGVGVRISPTANSQLWWFDEVCNRQANFRVIRKTDPEYAQVAAEWAMQELTADPRNAQ